MTVVLALFAIVVVIFAARLVDIQVVQAATLNAAAEGNRSVPEIIMGKRGSIVDANGNPLAETVDRFEVDADPLTAKQLATPAKGQKAIDLNAQYKKIGEITGQDPSDVQNIVENALRANAKSRWARVAQHLTLDQLNKLKALKVPWLSFVTTPTRVYPDGSVAGNLVGFVGQDGTPLAGLEYGDNPCLKATNGESTYERGGDGVKLPGSEVVTKKAKEGGTLETTIDPDMQWFAQQAVGKQVQATGARWGFAFVTEVKTGKVLAVSEYPSVDPNDPSATDADNRGSHAFTSPFEPGSTLKTVTAAALLDTGKATPTSHVVAPYSRSVNGAQFKDAEVHGDERLTLAGVLAQSSNTGISILGERLSAAQRYDYLKKFGLGEKTAIDFPGEASGTVHPWQKWDVQTNYATMFGQGLTATAPQVAGIMQTLGNDGVRVPLQLVKGCKNADGTFTAAPKGKSERVVSKQAAQGTVRMMESVVSDGFLKDLLQIPGYRVAAKSGTAQVADGSGYGNNYLVSMAGVAPADNPQYVVTVALSNPATIKTSAAAAPVFTEIMADALQRYKVPPSTPADPIPTTY